MRLIAVKVLVFSVCLNVGFSIRCCAQEARQIGHFYTLDGSTQFLPGGFVLRTEDNQRTLLSYRDGKFTELTGPGVSSVLEDWRYFDWETVDWQDQLNRNAPELPRHDYWPPQARIKKVLPIQSWNAPLIDVFVCYTLPQSKVQPGVFPMARDIFILALQGNLVSPGKYIFTKLWTIKAERESSYGDFTVQQVSGIGEVGVLYSGSLSASSEIEQLALFKLAVKPKGKLGGMPTWPSVRGPGRNGKTGKQVAGSHL